MWARAIGRRLDILTRTGRRRGGGVGSRASSARTAREETRWGRGRSTSPGAASARRRPCRRRRVGDGPAPTRVGRRRRPSEVATANAGRAVRGAFWSSRDGAVLSQRETSAAGGGPRRAPCVLAQRDGQPPRPLAGVEGSGHYGSQFPLIGSRLQPDQGPDVSSETRWTHALDRRARRCGRAPRFIRFALLPSPKICAGELLLLQLGNSKSAGTP